MDLLNSFSYALNMLFILIIIVAVIIYHKFTKNSNTTEDVDTDKHTTDWETEKNIEYICIKEPNEVKNCTVRYYKNENVYIIGLNGFSENITLNKLSKTHPAYHYDIYSKDEANYNDTLYGYRYIVHYSIIDKNYYDFVLYDNDIETIAYVFDTITKKTVKVYRINEW